MTRIALLQMTASTDPQANIGVLEAAISEAAGGGAAMLFTPEMSLLLDSKRARAAAHIRRETEDPGLKRLREAAAAHNIWLALGSAAVLAAPREANAPQAKGSGEGVDEPSQAPKWANRSLLIDNSGAIAARYDKMHMFDVQLASGETWRESAAYQAGEAVVSAETPVGRLGLAICYDLRFPALFDALGRSGDGAGCDVIALPAAFTVPTGRDHWHILLRARAIESSCYVVAAAQVGAHPDGRKTYGHSLVVDPWGEIVLDMGSDMGSDMGGTQVGCAGDAQGAVGFAEIDPKRIAEVRAQLPSLANRRKILE